MANSWWPRSGRLAPGAALVLGLVGLGVGVHAQDAPRHALGHPGYVIVDGAADTSGTFRWLAGPDPTRRTLTWPHGVLVVPRDLAVEDYGPHDLAVPCSAELAGAGHGGRLVFTDGTYSIDEPIFLTDGVITFYAADGELEILHERIRYRIPGGREGDPRATYVFLAGMLLLIIVLMRRARHGFRRARPA